LRQIDDFKKVSGKLKFVAILGYKEEGFTAISNRRADEKRQPKSRDTRHLVLCFLSRVVIAQTSAIYGYDSTAKYERTFILYACCKCEYLLPFHFPDWKSILLNEVLRHSALETA
jgi:hypothetical protein